MKFVATRGENINNQIFEVERLKPVLLLTGIIDKCACFYMTVWPSGTCQQEAPHSCSDARLSGGTCSSISLWSTAQVCRKVLVFFICYLLSFKRTLRQKSIKL